MSEWIFNGNEELAYKTPIFDVVKQPMLTPDEKVFNAVKIKAPDWISAVIVNKDTKKIVMVKEFRHGIARMIYEFPSGTYEEGETIENTCIREVKEETGYEDVKIVKKLFTASPNPAFMMNKMNSFLVEVSGAPNKQHLDADEFITIEEKAIDEVDSLINDYEDVAISQKLSWTLAKEEIRNLYSI